MHAGACICVGSRRSGAAASYNLTIISAVICHLTWSDNNSHRPNGLHDSDACRALAGKPSLTHALGYAGPSACMHPV
eukprot:889650-Pleurochrysis_carterae.AAC.4